MRTGIIRLVSVFCLLACSLDAQQAGQKSCQDFAQHFYDWYVPVALKENAVPASDLALKYKGDAFSPQLFRWLEDDSRAQAKIQGQIVGLDFDPFLNSQDPDKRYVIGKVSLKGDRCLVEVYPASSGKNSEKPVVVPELAFVRGKWLFVNFHYRKGGHGEHEDLLSILKSLREEREKHRQ